MQYDVKKAVENIDLYMQRHKKAEPMTMHDKQVVARHILPLVSTHTQVAHTDTVPQPEKKTVKKAKKAVKKSKTSTPKATFDESQDLSEKQKPEEMGENLLD